MESAQRIAFDTGMTHYDPPPPAEGLDLEELREADRFRFANVLGAWIEVDPSGRISDAGYSGGGLMGSTTVSLAGLRHNSKPSSSPTYNESPSTERAGCASCRRWAAARACPPLAG